MRGVTTTSETGGRDLLAILAIAFLGGMVLNLMPCVLPVLSLKLLALVRHDRRERTAVRLGFVASSAGIVASFLVLGAVLAGLKAAGVSVGWGIQFQHPWFLVAMVFLVMLFAANLWGIIEIRLPRWAADLGAPSATEGLPGNFAAGALATLLATPCSAPFVGTAVGFALAAGPAEILSVFAAMGFGLAAPYLTVAAFPFLARALPRPGRWMGTVRLVLGLLLVGTAVWLLTVLAAVADSAAAVGVAGLIVVAAVALAFRQKAAGTPWARAAFASTAAACVVAALAILGGQEPSAGASRPQEAAWHRFAEDDIAGLVRSGMVVFVDLTAEWCVTCRVNEKIALSAPEVRRILADDRVVAMRGDWTRPDERITAYMARHGRYGVPFNAVYGPGRPDGALLPELLSSDIVTTAIDDARRSVRFPLPEADGKNAH
ncbi:MAG: thioredoxin family protein [Rhodospirillales bacterium]|nr:thioredoxin family protein [Rhodospirillales bacterium]